MKSRRKPDGLRFFHVVYLNAEGVLISEQVRAYRFDVLDGALVFRLAGTEDDFIGRATFALAPGRWLEVAEKR